ncbi:hypothetical protein KJ780_02675 [Candidatus Micrarchaeota archaeon]|nr:hypothetical protein [Candidatus Micrarchaeota archaeon]
MKSANEGESLGKTIKPKEKEPKETAQEVPLSKEEEGFRSNIKEAENAFAKFRLYPIATSTEEKDESILKIKKLYETGDERLKQIILYLANEMLMQFSEYRAPKNLEYFKRRFPQNDGTQNRMNIYRAMFNHSTSLEGIIELLDLLASLKGPEAAKVLTYYFSFLCAFDASEASRILRNSAVEALGKSDSEYSLKALIRYAKTADNDQLSSRILNSLSEWKEKLHKLKISQSQKDSFAKEISKLLMVEREGAHYR